MTIEHARERPLMGFNVSEYIPESGIYHQSKVTRPQIPSAGNSRCELAVRGSLRYQNRSPGGMADPASNSVTSTPVVTSRGSPARQFTASCQGIAISWCRPGVADGHGIPASFSARAIRAALCPASRSANIHATTGAVAGSGSSRCARRVHPLFLLSVRRNRGEGPPETGAKVPWQGRERCLTLGSLQGKRTWKLDEGRVTREAAVDGKPEGEAGS